MKKVILKYQLKNRERFEDNLSDMDLDFSAIYWQHDRIYVPRGFKPGMNYPRLILCTEMHAVDEPPKYKLILRRHIEDSDIDIIEESPVEDYASIASIILQLGFKLAGEVSRRRQDLSLGDSTMIYLDEVDGLGKIYAKIEAILPSEGDVTATELRDALAKTMKSLGENDIYEQPYLDIKE